MVETMRTVKGYDGVIRAIALVSVRPSAPPPFTPTQPRVATRLNTGPWFGYPGTGAPAVRQPEYIGTFRDASQKTVESALALSHFRQY